MLTRLAGKYTWTESRDAGRSPINYLLKVPYLYLPHLLVYHLSRSPLSRGLHLDLVTPASVTSTHDGLLELANNFCLPGTVAAHIWS